MGVLRECKKYSLDITGLKKPSALTKVIDSVPLPGGARPNFGLPKWRTMPLESKIPMVAGPKDAYNFTRGKVGENVWTSTPDAQFNLSDPYCREIELNYDSLHDKHLAEFFLRPSNANFLIKAGLVSDDLAVKCSLKDYNMYRKFLRKLHCDGIKKELRRREKLLDEKVVLEFAGNEAQKEVTKLRRRQRLHELRQGRYARQMEEERENRRRQREKEQRLKDRLVALELATKQEREAQRAIKAMHAERIRRKLATAAHLRRLKIVHTLVEWKRKEIKRKKEREIRLAREKEEKLRIIEEKWKIRQEVQERQIKKEHFLMKCIHAQREEFIKKYNRNVQRERRRMKKLFKEAKMFTKCYLRRRLSKKQKIICCKKYLHRERDKKAELKKLVCSFDPSISAKDFETFLKEYPVKDLQIFSGDADDHDENEQGKKKTCKQIFAKGEKDHKNQQSSERLKKAEGTNKKEFNKKQRTIGETHVKKYSMSKKNGSEPITRKPKKVGNEIVSNDSEAVTIDPSAKFEESIENKAEANVILEQNLIRKDVFDGKQVSKIPLLKVKQKCKCKLIKGQLPKYYRNLCICECFVK